jgi:hypothetical protein
VKSFGRALPRSRLPERDRVVPAIPQPPRSGAVHLVEEELHFSNLCDGFSSPPHRLRSPVHAPSVVDLELKVRVVAKTGRVDGDLEVLHSALHRPAVLPIVSMTCQTSRRVAGNAAAAHRHRRESGSAGYVHSQPLRRSVDECGLRLPTSRVALEAVEVTVRTRNESGFRLFVVSLGLPCIV